MKHKMEVNYHNAETKVATAGGTLMVLLFKANIDDRLMSALLAAIGATVSFGVSMLLKFIVRRLTRK